MPMNNESKDLQRLVAELADLIEHNNEPDPKLYTLFLQHPEFSFKLIDLINSLDEEGLNEGPPVYSACIFGLDLSVAQLQAAKEANNKNSAKLLDLLMNHLAENINANNHSLGFWLPVLNAFYDVHVELTEALKNAYFELASAESEQLTAEDEHNHLDSIRELIHDLSDLSVFDIAEHFFAQSYAMPADFFGDLILDLSSIEEGQEIAILALLHPKAEVREVVIATLDQIIDKMNLSPVALTRLQSIMYWCPEAHQASLMRWIKHQRKKGVVFAPDAVVPKIKIKATEVDGSGAQGLFVHMCSKKKNRLCGLLLKYDFGVKDAWVTPEMKASEVKEYYHQAFDESVTIREIDLDYLQIMVAHFLSISLANGQMPNIYFLEIQELLGLHFRPKRLDAANLIEQLSVQIAPFTQEVITESLQRSKSWLKNKPFTESWYLESPVIDKIVNHNSSFVDGVKVCRMDDAMNDVFLEEMEKHRGNWQFHFLWVALWFKAKEKKNEKVWRDSFLIAYNIHQGVPLHDIPVMKEICRQTVINSVETMQERRTHLSKE